MRNSILSFYICLVFSFTATNLMFAQWIQTNGYNGTIHSVFVSDTNLFAGTNGGGIFLSENDGVSWTAVDSGLTGLSRYVNSFAVIGSDLFAGTRTGVFLSTNDGTSWREVDSGFTSIYSHFILSLAVIGTNLFAGTQGGGAYISSNYGKNWTAINSGLPTFYVASFAVMGTNLFAGMLSGDNSSDGGVRLSTNNGTTWTVADSGLPINSTVYSFVVSGTNLFAGLYGGLYLSTNNGRSWIEADSSLNGLTVLSLVVSGSNLFAGTNNGVWLSTNNGENWRAVNSGLQQLYIGSLVIVGDTLFAGTGGGVWKRPLSDMITSVNQTAFALPTNFILQQNYPNPFNPSTTINYSVPKADLVTIKIYDILGREVVTLVNQQKNPGNYEVQFNANNLPSGIYFYRMQAGGFVSTKKFVLLK